MAIGRRQLEIHHGGRFHVVGQVTVLDDEAGYRGAARFEYDLDYVLGALGARDARAVSCRYPVGFATEDEPVWPAFLLDLMPSGAARRFWEAELGLPGLLRADWSRFGATVAFTSLVWFVNSNSDKALVTTCRCACWSTT